MTGGGGGGGGEGGRRAPPQQQPQPPTTGGEFLLQLLQKPHQPQPQNPFVNSSPSSSTPLPSSHTVHPPPPHLDPAAVASLGPNFPFPSNGHDHPQHHPLPPWMLNPTNFPPTPNNTPWGLTGLPPPPNLHHLPIFADELQRLGLLGGDGRVVHQQQQQQQKEQGIMMFGSVPANFRNNEGGLNGNFMDQRSVDVDRRNAETQFGVHSAHVNRRNLESQFGFHKSREVVGASPCPDIWSNPNQWDNSSQGSVGGRARQQQHVPLRSSPVGEPRSTPPGFPQKLKALNQWGSVSQRQELEGNVVKEDNSQDRLNSQAHHSYNNDKVIRSNSQGNASSRLRLSGQLDHPGPPVGSKLMSVPALDIEESLAILRGQFVEEDGGYNSGRHENRVRDDTSGPAHRMSGRHGQEDLSEELMNAVRISNGLEKNIIRHNINSRDKDLIFDISKELQPPGQRMRNNNRRVVECRSDIDKMDAPFLKIYESLVPEEEEKAKQKQLLTSLEKLVNKEWPSAQLYLYGSCANSFGVSNSDIDVCLAIEDENINKSELLLKLADILQEDNLQNVQALTRARVPIVKLLDPVTGISCDICVNNVLAVVNTKLLRDYAQIDGRLRQLAFIVKYWAKSRGVNVTYQGTLSSYAYVLMCIHFLQQRKPSILPCLQAMEATYVVSIDDIECAYFDQVQNLRDFGARNKETIAQLVWAFFDYWAYRHDYANAVISVRTGSIISKRAKDWTRRIGNDRHLICIEDPFETSHDLGRVVDKYSIKILREEFERAANIMQYDPDPCVTLFERYVPS